MSERFKRSRWRRRIESSAGYSVRLAGRTGVEYRDSLGELRVDAEVMAEPGIHAIVYEQSVPDSPDRPKELVLGRLENAFAFAGWKLTRDAGGA